MNPITLTPTDLDALDRYIEVLRDPDLLTYAGENEFGDPITSEDAAFAALPEDLRSSLTEIRFRRIIAQEALRAPLSAVLKLRALELGVPCVDVPLARPENPGDIKGLPNWTPGYHPNDPNP